MNPRAQWLLVAALTCLTPQALAPAASLHAPDTFVRIGVFGLFHPRQLTIRPHQGQPVALRCGDRTLHIEGGQSIHLTLRRQSIECRSGSLALAASEADIAQADADFVLEVPGKIERHYRGALMIVPSGNELLAAVAMSRETAVASIIAAETSTASPLEALRAQAVVTRSYLAAGPRHKDFDFCDTTHCQYLVAPPAPREPAADAAVATKDMVLAYQGVVIRALYSARCGGETRTIEDIGLKPDSYPYFRVPCASCIRTPESWTRQFNKQQAANLIREPGSETARLQVVRTLGWQALPSNNYEISATATGVTFRGTGSGHGVGLCQHGATAMASEGRTFPSILRHYFPNTTLLPAP